MGGRSKKMRVIMVGGGGYGGCRRERMRETGLFEIVAAYDHNPEFGDQKQRHTVSQAVSK